MHWIDSLLNRVTMYALMAYYLTALAVISVILAFLGVLPYDPWFMIAGIAVLYGTAKILNPLLGKIFKILPNRESSAISGLILALIIGPAFAWLDLRSFVFVSVVAMLSKYILVFQRRHIFNPAAFAVVISAITIGAGASWWVGSISMVPFVIIGGLLLLRKMRWFHLVFSFLITYLVATTAIYAFSNPGAYLNLANLGDFALTLLLYSPALFFAFVMLTEPLTMPSGKKQRIIYGIMVAILAVILPLITQVSYTLELSLLIGNLVGWILFGNTRRFLKLAEKKEVAKNSTMFEFTPNAQLSFVPGQFLLWSLPHPKGDLRGHRRYFTIASSPTENRISLVTKFAEKSSTFKTKLKELATDGEIITASLDGDFTLPKSAGQPVVFIAGGIGIAPFRSMVKYLLDKGESRPITLLYSNNSAEEIAFKDLFDQAKEKFGMKTVYTLTDPKQIPPDWKGRTGYIDANAITAEVPHYKKALYYISGPDPMVRAMEKTLRKLGIPRRQIKTDYFPGYV